MKRALVQILVAVANIQMRTLRWASMTMGTPFDAGTKVYDIIRASRKRKGIKEDLPPLDEYLDKL